MTATGFGATSPSKIQRTRHQRQPSAVAGGIPGVSSDQVPAPERFPSIFRTLLSWSGRRNQQRSKRLRHWVGVEARKLDRLADDTLIDRLLGSSTVPGVVFLGESNHFVQQKSAFRLYWIQALALRTRVFLVEELGFADGHCISAFLRTGDDTSLAQAAIFGGTAHRREDRDDGLRGVLQDAEQNYPHAQMLNEHRKFYTALRRLPGLCGFQGIDLDPPGCGYRWIPAHLQRSSSPGNSRITHGLKPVPGESRVQETRRLQTLLSKLDPQDGTLADIRADLQAMIDSLQYRSLIGEAIDYPALRPAMRMREEIMKHRIDGILERLSPGTTLVIMGHAFHLAKRDSHIESQGVGPGGDETPSLGHYLVQERGIDARSVWMIYGSGEDAQPLRDLPRKADFPRETINRQLLDCTGEAVCLPVREAREWLPGAVRFGHLYNNVVNVDLAEEADVVTFFPRVTPLSLD